MQRKQPYHHRPRHLRLRWLFATFFVFLGAIGVQSSAKAQEIPRKVLEQNSLAASEFKNGNFEAALPYLRWLLENAPTVYNSERVHRRAVVSYYSLADSTAETGLSVAYLDSALGILQTAPTVFDSDNVDYDRVRWENDFGNFLIKYGNRIDGLEDEAVDHYRAAYDLEPAGTNPYYIRMIVHEYLRLDRIDEALSFMDDAEQHFSDDPDIVAWFEEVRDKAIRSPEDRIEFLKEKLARDSTNLETARELFTIYSQLGRTSEVEAMGELLLRLHPTTDTFVQVADLKAENGQYRDALGLYTQALASMAANASPTVRRDIEFKMAVSSYELGQLESAKVHAVRAVNQDKKYGSAYVLIGDILVKAVSESEFERRDKAVYWLAMDYYEMAASVDPTVRETAREKVQRYKAYMPTEEEKFFAGWHTGEEYAVDYGRYAWVDETTEVR